jgi:hypothetical protein
MQEVRASFNPCELQGIVYLCGYGSDSIEAFNPAIAAFLPLSARLPEDSSCLIFVERGSLVVLSKNYVSRWTVERMHCLLLQSKAVHPIYGVYCNMAPVVDEGSGVVYISYDGRCYCMKMDGSGRREVGS